MSMALGLPRGLAEERVVNKQGGDLVHDDDIRELFAVPDESPLIGNGECVSLHAPIIHKMHQGGTLFPLLEVIDRYAVLKSVHEADVFVKEVSIFKMAQCVPASSRAAFGKFGLICRRAGRRSSL